PLPIITAEVLLPSYALRFINPGSPLTLLYGNPSMQAPRYDLALLAPRLFGQSSHEVTLAAAEPADTAGTTSRERKIFWIVIAAAAVVLLRPLVGFWRTVGAPASGPAGAAPPQSTSSRRASPSTAGRRASATSWRT